VAIDLDIITRFPHPVTMITGFLLVSTYTLLGMSLNVYVFLQKNGFLMTRPAEI